MRSKTIEIWNAQFNTKYTTGSFSFIQSRSLFGNTVKTKQYFRPGLALPLGDAFQVPGLGTSKLRLRQAFPKGATFLDVE